MLTAPGVVILVAGLIAAVTGGRRLVLLLAFLGPWSGVAVVNVAVGEGRHVQPWVAVASFLAVRLLWDVTIRGRAFWTGRLGRLLFLWAVQRVSVEAGATFRTATQAAYVVLGTLTVLGVANYVQSVDDARKYWRYAVAGGLAMALGGWAQLGFRLWGLEWPWWWFNNSISPFAQGWRQEAAILGLPRMSAGAAEASLFAEAVGVNLVLALGQGGAALSFTSAALMSLLLVVSLVLSMTTTGYVVLVGLAAFGSRRVLLGGVRRWAVWFALAVASTLMVTMPFLWLAVREYLVEKPLSISFQDRLESVVVGLSAWKEGSAQVRLLGWDPGAMVARSLPVWLLTNTGVLGLVTFTLAVGTGLLLPVRSAAPLGLRCTGLAP